MKDRKAEFTNFVEQTQTKITNFLRKSGFRIPSNKTVHQQIQELGEVPKSWGKPSNPEDSELWKKNKD